MHDHITISNGVAQLELEARHNWMDFPECWRNYYDHVVLNLNHPLNVTMVSHALNTHLAEHYNLIRTTNDHDGCDHISGTLEDMTAWMLTYA